MGWVRGKRRLCSMVRQSNPASDPHFMREAELIPQSQSFYTTVRASLL